MINSEFGEIKPIDFFMISTRNFWLIQDINCEKKCEMKFIGEPQSFNHNKSLVKLKHSPQQLHSTLIQYYVIDN